SAAVVAGGTGYTLGDVLTVNNGVNGTLLPPATAATLRVTAVAALSVSVSAGGTGYAVGDVLTIVGGTRTVAVTVTVTTINAATGAVTGVLLTTPGSYSALPGNPAATTSSSA